MSALLVARGLTRRVGDRTLFSDLDLELADGECLAVEGPSGCGKTALLRALAGLDPLDAGQLSLDGWTPLPHEWPRWRHAVRYAAQGAPVLGGTPALHLAAVRRLGTWRSEGAERCLAVARELGVEAAWDQPWTTLSGGERQRLQLAVALGDGPRVLLLDEPTAALDPEAVGRVEALLAGLTRVWVSHDRAQAERVGDRVLRLGP